MSIRLSQDEATNEVRTGNVATNVTFKIRHTASVAMRHCEYTQQPFSITMNQYEHVIGKNPCHYPLERASKCHYSWGKVRFTCSPWVHLQGPALKNQEYCNTGNEQDCNRYWACGDDGGERLPPAVRDGRRTKICGAVPSCRTLQICDKHGFGIVADGFEFCC